jgi:hypothetical protein
LAQNVPNSHYDRFRHSNRFKAVTGTKQFQFDGITKYGDEMVSCGTLTLPSFMKMLHLSGEHAYVTEQCKYTGDRAATEM